MARLVIDPGFAFDLSHMRIGVRSFHETGGVFFVNTAVPYGDMLKATLGPNTAWGPQMAWLGPDIDMEGGAVVGGILTAIVADQAYPEPSWALTDIELDAAQAYAVAMTTDLRDDAALLASLFRGHDDISIWDINKIGVVMHGYAGDDYINGGFGDDLLYGDSGNDRVEGDPGNDTLYGGAGDDTLDGGSGDDQYFVSSSLDVVTENPPSSADPGGHDRVSASASFTLGDRLEDLLLLEGGAFSGTGNGLANTVTGNASANVLAGMAGADTLAGGAGADTIVIHAAVGTSSDSTRVAVSGSNNDTGQDVVRGFSLAEDTLRIAGSNVSRFVHGEDTAVGLGSGVEATGGRSSFAAGTGLVELNQATNNAWNDAGDIVVSFQSASAALTETAFEARLQYVLTGTAAGNTLAGGRLADTLDGGAGNDGITGGGGLDRLTGGAGNDVFDYNAVAESGVLSTTRDVISDFTRGQDRIDLRTLDANAMVAGDQAFGATLVGAFTAAGQLRFADGVLYGNTDADAAAEFSIRLNGVSALAASDVLL